MFSTYSLNLSLRSSCPPLRWYFSISLIFFNNSLGSAPAKPLGMHVLELAALLEGNLLLAAMIAAPMWDILIDPSSSSLISFIVGSSKTGVSLSWGLSATLANQLKNQIIPTPTHKVKSKIKRLQLSSKVESHPCKWSWIRLKAPARALWLTLRTKTRPGSSVPSKQP